MLLLLLVTNGCHRIQTPASEPPTPPPWEDFLVDSSEAVPADPEARAAEIAALSDRRLTPAEQLRLADLMLADAVVRWRREAEDHHTKDGLTNTHDIAEATDRTALQVAWSRYLRLIEEHPETPGLEQSILHLVVLERARTGRADLAQSPVLIDNWRQVWPNSPAVTGAELLWFSHTDDYCLTRRLTTEAAASLWNDPNLDLVLGFDERLARRDLQGFNKAVALADDLSLRWWGRLCRWSEDSEACEEQNAHFQAEVYAAKERAIPVYESVLAAGWEPEVADGLYWLAMDTDNQAKAEVVALKAEEAAAYEQAMWFWEGLWDTNNSPEQRARLVEHEVALAVRLGKDDVIDRIAQRLREKEPENAVDLYQRAIEVEDAGGSCRCGDKNDSGRRMLLVELAKLWRKTGKIEEATAWFEAHSAIDIWRASAPPEGPTPVDSPPPQR